MKIKAIILSLILIIIFLTGFIFWQRAAILKKRRGPPPARRVSTPKVAEKKERVSRRPAVKARKFKNPRVAIVMDDFGYNMNNLEELFSIRQPVTLSILPSLRYSRRIADIAVAHGYEIILHLPMEAHNKDIREEEGTIRCGMAKEEVIALLDKDIAGVPGLKGVSNHMGSKATEDRGLMEIVLKYLKKRRLYFFDSFTSQKSVGSDVARAEGLRSAKRDIFLDNLNDFDYIEKQMWVLKKFAFARGRAIAICHDRRNTVRALKKLMPDMAKDGIIFVYLSELVK